MILKKFIAIYSVWFIDYIMMDKILLDKAWKSGNIFLEKAEKNDKQFVGDWFVKEAKVN